MRDPFEEAKSFFASIAETPAKKLKKSGGGLLAQVHESEYSYSESTSQEDESASSFGSCSSDSFRSLSLRKMRQIAPQIAIEFDKNGQAPSSALQNNRSC